MKCPTCDFETEDQVQFLAHLMDCEANPEDKWFPYVELELDARPEEGNFSEQFELSQDYKVD